MPGFSPYERLLIDSLLMVQHPPRPIEPGAGLFVGPTDPYRKMTFDLAVQPAMRKNGLNGSELRVVFDDYSSLADVCTFVQTAEVIVVDLSDLNPSVLYVLGLCHGLGRCPIVLTRQIRQLPFNLHTLRHIEYSPAKDGLFDLRERLERALRVFLVGARKKRRGG